MNADHDIQLQLLDLQGADTALAQLAHRRKSLPELAAIGEHTMQLDELHNLVVDAQSGLDDLAVEQRKLENEVDAVRTRAARDEARLQTGGLPARELEGLQHEIVTLARRQSSLEDDLLEVMERVEEAGTALAELTSRRDGLVAEQQNLEARRDAALGEIDAASARRALERDGVAAGLPADLLAVYDKARAHGGVGAAMLRQRRCEGCHIELSGSELSAMRTAPPDLVARCDNCRAVLVRTAESGL